MNRKFRIDLVTNIRFLADEAEQMAHHVHRMMDALNAIVDDIKAFYVGVIVPFLAWLMSTEPGQPAKA